jgi:hypothetical protein
MGLQIIVARFVQCFSFLLSAMVLPLSACCDAPFGVLITTGLFHAAAQRGSGDAAQRAEQHSIILPFLDNALCTAACLPPRSLYLVILTKEGSVK